MGGSGAPSFTGQGARSLRPWQDTEGVDGHQISPSTGSKHEFPHTPLQHLRPFRQWPSFRQRSGGLGFLHSPVSARHFPGLTLTGENGATTQRLALLDITPAPTSSLTHACRSLPLYLRTLTEPSACPEGAPVPPEDPSQCCKCLTDRVTQLNERLTH